MMPVSIGGSGLLAVAGLATAELFLRVGVVRRCKALAETAARSVRVLRRRASDHWKERAITSLWLQMMRRTAALAMTLLVVLLPLGLLYAMDRAWNLGAFAGMDFGPIHLALIVTLIGYVILRRRAARD